MARGVEVRDLREGGLEAALQAAGGVGRLARTLGISQPAVSAWKRVPADRVLAVEAITGISRVALRPDLYPEEVSMNDPETTSAGAPEIDEVDAARGQEYTLLSILLGREPSAEVLSALARLTGDASPLGLAHIALADAAAAASPASAGREYFRIFVGVGRGELLAYASYYLTGFVHERPLAHVRSDLGRLGIARSETMREPEDHIAILCEVMAGLAEGRFGSDASEQKTFFRRHLQPWAARFFADLEACKDAPLYRAVGTVGRLFMEIEAEAFDLDD